MTSKKPNKKAPKKAQKTARAMAQKTGPKTRAEPQSFRARTFTASLTAKDLQKSVAWYRDAVGFVVGREIQRDGRVVAVTMKAGTVEIMINQDDGAKGWDRIKGEGIGLYFTTAQRVDDIANRIKSSGGTISMEPADMPWGVRLFRVKDPDGFSLAISSERSS